MATEEEESADDWFDLGKYHSSFKNSRNAVECYQRCVSKDQKHFKAWSNMAAEYFKLRNYEKSIECSKQAIKIQETGKHAWLTLAANYFELNENGKALFCFHRAELMGSKKAAQFLERADKLHDNLMNAEIIDITSEILGKEEKEDLIEEIQKDVKERSKIWKYHRPKIPEPKQQDCTKKMEEFLLEFGEDLILETGGVISILELFALVKEKYPLFNGKPNDLLKALRALERKRLIVGVKSLPECNLKVVEFVPSELTTDVKKILELAQDTGYLTYEEISTKKQKWDEYRIIRNMEFLEGKNIARKVDSYREGVKWYFPSIQIKK